MTGRTKTEKESESGISQLFQEEASRLISIERLHIRCVTSCSTNQDKKYYSYVILDTCMYKPVVCQVN
jgi:hypothetical protein